MEPVTRPSMPSSTSSVSFIISYEQVSHFPKGRLRKQVKKSRRKLKSAILADTLIKNDIENKLK